MTQRSPAAAAVSVDTADGEGLRVESYAIDANRLVRRVQRRDGAVTETDLGPAPGHIRDPDRLHALADQRYLRSEKRPPALPDSQSPAVTVVDLFSGLGSLSLGVIEAARAIGRNTTLGLAADLDRPTLDVLEDSLKPPNGAPRCVDLQASLDGDEPRKTPSERALLSDCPKSVDVLVAGPPCQGHSRLNNHTRHNDVRNDLYACVSRFVELRKPRLCIIENVDSIVHDLRKSAAKAALRLQELDYSVDEGSVALHPLGVPQARKRHVLVATRGDQEAMSVTDVVERYAVGRPELRTVRWAIGDLQNGKGSRDIDVPSTPSSTNLERMQWLHDEDEVNLPNLRRPDCHRLPKRTESGEVRKHSYRSMYGRLRWDLPAQTITSGFGSMGQGRYVHPTKVRTLTPHEAARLQFIPDFMRLEAAEGRGRWARMIGNVAPLKLSYVFALEFLR